MEEGAEEGSGGSGCGCACACACACSGANRDAPPPVPPPQPPPPPSTAPRASAAATVMWKDEPCPRPGDCAVSVPPIASARGREMASPRPAPSNGRDVDPSAWVNGAKMEPSVSDDIPMPESTTEMVTRRGSDAAGARVAEECGGGGEAAAARGEEEEEGWWEARSEDAADMRISTTPPRWENLMALTRQLRSTCARRHHAADEERRKNEKCAERRLRKHACNKRCGSTTAALGLPGAKETATSTRRDVEEGPTIWSARSSNGSSSTGRMSSDILEEASRWEKSRMSDTSTSRLSPDATIVLVSSCCGCDSGVSCSSEEEPMMPFSGVRI